MKKIVALLLALVMVFALVACGNTNEQPSGNPSTPSNPSNPSDPGTPSGPVAEEPVINFDEDPL